MTVKEPAALDMDGHVTECQERSAADLFRTHAAFVARLVARLGVPACDLDDAVQEVFLVTHRRGGFAPDRAREKTWLAEIAVRVAANVRRSKRRRPTVHDEAAIERVRSDASDPQASLEARERLERVVAALETLGEEARLVFVLLEIEGLAGEEVARARGVPVGTIYSRLHAARKAFRAAYERTHDAPSRPGTLLALVRLRLGLEARTIRLAEKELSP